MEDIIQFLARVDPVWIYVVIFSISFIENIFPPSPSDVVVVFGGALAAIGRGSVLVSLVSGTVGATLGFMTVYVFGRWFGSRIIESGKIKFISLEHVRKAEQWFAKYGDLIIVANRFLAGTRSVISLFAGISKLNFPKTFVLSFISSLAWYGILVYSGYSLGHHWHKIYGYLYAYSWMVMSIIVLTTLIVFVRWAVLNSRKKRQNV